MSDIVSVDSHYHLWKLTGNNYPWIEERIDAPGMRAIARDFEASDFHEVMSRHSVERSVLVQGEPTVAETDEMLAIARENPFIAGVVGWIDLEKADASAEMARRAADPLFKGLRLWLLRNEDPAWILRDTQNTGLTAVEEAGLRVDALLRPQHMSNLGKMLERYPALKVVICHAAKPEVTEWSRNDDHFKSWATGIRQLAKQGCYMKLSGIMTESGNNWTIDDVRPYVETILEFYGPYRTMWGSDWPVINRGGGYTKWLDAIREISSGLSSEEQAALFGGTATEFYRLEPGPGSA